METASYRWTVKAAPKHTKTQLKDFLQADSVIEVFDMLDHDGSGEVENAEFLEKMVNAATSSIGSDAMVFKILQRLKLLMKDMDTVERKRAEVEHERGTFLRRLDLRLENIDGAIRRIGSEEKRAVEKRHDKSGELAGLAEEWEAAGGWEVGRVIERDVGPDFWPGLRDASAALIPSSANEGGAAWWSSGSR